MPFIVAPIAAALVGIGLSTALATAIAQVIVSVVLTTVVGFISKMLFKPPKPAVPDFSVATRENKTMVRQPISPFTVTFGEDRLSGPITFVEATNGNQKLHMLLTLSSVPLGYWKRVYLNDEYLPLLSTGAPPPTNGQEIAGGVNGSFGVTLPILNATVGTQLQQFSGQSGAADTTVVFPGNETGIVPIAKKAWNRGFKCWFGLGSENKDSALHTQLQTSVGSSLWSNQHKQSGCGKLLIEFTYVQDLFAGSLPTVTAVVGGMPLYDPRDTALDIVSSAVGSPGVITITGHGLAVDDFIWIKDHDSTPELKRMYRVASVPSADTITLADRWDQAVDITTGAFGGTATKMWVSPNTALQSRMYLADPVFGRNAEDSSIDDDDTVASANTCEEQVVLRQDGVYSDTFTHSSDLIILSEHIPFLATGDGVRFTSTDTLPTGLSSGTTYYWVDYRFGVGRVAPTFKDAWRRTNLITLTGGAGEHTMVRYSEARYTSDFTFKTDENPRVIMALMANAMAGNLICEGGTWRILAGGWRTPTFTLEDRDLDGPIELTTAVSRQEIFNRVKGTFVNREKFWQPDTFPPVTNETYLAEDGGHKIWQDIDLPTSMSPSRCQRIGKIRLEQMRQQITGILPVKLRAFVLMPTDVFGWTRSRYGFSNKYFEVVNWKFTIRGEDDRKRLGIDLIVRETAAAIWDWNNGEETLIDLAPNTNLPLATAVLTPSDLSVDEEQYVTRDGLGVKTKVTLNWVASGDGFVDFYEARYSLSGSSDYTYIAPISRGSTFAEIPDFPISGTYMFEVRAKNAFGAYSDWVPHTQFIVGLSPPPEQLTGLTIAMSSGYAFLRWDPSPDLDVRIGGHILFKWSPDTGATDVTNSVSIGEDVEGKMTLAVLPLKPGTYFAVPVDSEGHPGPASYVSTDGAEVLPWVNLATITEDPTFSGIMTEMVNSGGFLQLDGLGLVDDIADFDLVSSLDSFGGIVDAGEYAFATNYDRGSVGPFRVRTHLRAYILNLLDLIDDRSDNVDDWEDWDGVEVADVADAQVWLSSTDDDPSGAPVWNPYHRGDLNEYNARAVRAKIVAFTRDASYNILIDQARLEIEEL